MSRTPCPEHGEQYVRIGSGWGCFPCLVESRAVYIVRADVCPEYRECRDPAECKRTGTCIAQLVMSDA